MDREPCNNILNPALGHMPSLRALKLDRLFLSEQGKNRFQKMSVTHPRQHAIVMDRMGMREAMEMINVKVEYGQ